MNMDVVVVTDTADNMNGVQYMDIDEIHSFELKRDDIRFVRLLGSGNFGEVFKATMSNETVAVKCLKGEAFHDSDCAFVVNNLLLKAFPKLIHSVLALKNELRCIGTFNVFQYNLLINLRVNLASMNSCILKISLLAMAVCGGPSWFPPKICLFTKSYSLRLLVSDQ